MRLIRAEWYRMVHSKIQWGITVALLLLSFWMLDSKRMAHVGGQEILLLIWQNPLPLMWSGVMLAVGGFGSSFQERCWNGGIYKGQRRMCLLLSRAFFYYIWGLLIQAVAMAIIFTKYQVWGQMLGLGIEFLFPRMLFHSLFGIALLTPPLLFSFLFRDVFVSMTVSSGLTFLIQNMLGREGEGFLPELMEHFYPAARMLKLHFWMALETRAIQEAFLLCLGYLVIGLLVSVVMFWQGELK